VHTVGELIYQSVLGGFGDVAASPDPDATANERDTAQGLSTDSAILSADATDEEKKKSILQNVGKIISFSAHTVKEAVLAHIDQDHNEPLPDHREDEIHDTQTWNKVPVEANMDIISVVVPSDPGNQQTNGERNDDDREAEEGGEKSIIQSVGEMITHSAQSMKEILANGHIPSLPGKKKSSRIPFLLNLLPLFPLQWDNSGTTIEDFDLYCILELPYPQLWVTRYITVIPNGGPPYPIQKIVAIKSSKSNMLPSFQLRPPSFSHETVLYMCADIQV
jgi:hypothetical protein